MHESVITWDESGELLSGAFFEFVVPLDIDFTTSYADSPGKEKWILGRNQTNERSLWAKVERIYERRYECPINRQHQTGRELNEVDAQLFSGPFVADLIADAFGLTVIASTPFVKRLSDSRLIGVESRELPIWENQSFLADPELQWLTFLGRDCLRPRKINVPAVNACPFCGWGPIICPECKDIQYTCPCCKESIFVLAAKHGGSIDKRWIIDPLPPEGHILEGKLWDGQDFVCGHNEGFISNNVLRWLQDTGASPFIAKPCRVCVDGMENTKIAKLESYMRKKSTNL